MYFITIKRMLEVCFSAHPNIQYRAGISLETHSFLFCKFYGSVKEKNTMSGSNKLA